MLRDSVFDLLVRRLGKRTDLQPFMQTEMELLQTTSWETKEELPWFLLTTEEQDLVVDAAVVDCPADFLKQQEDESISLYFSDGEGFYIPLKSFGSGLNRMRAAYPGSGCPKAYCIIAEKIYFAPTPDTTYAAKWFYFAKDEVLTSNAENRWLKFASDFVIAELGYVMSSTHMQHPSLPGVFQGESSKAWDRIMRETTARAEANRSRVMEA